MTKIMRPTLIDPTTEMAFMPIPGGQFIMGSPETEKDRQRSEGPQHVVKIQEFYLAQCAVTQEQYLKVMGENPSDLRGEQCPVDGVSWDDAQAFIAKLNAINNTHYRLPSEAQWEYACRANTHTRFSFGDEITIAQVNFGAKISCRNTPSGMHPANGFGLYDMHGNVFEWCEDTWHDSYEGAPVDGTAWVDDSSDHKVYRGGAWNASSHFARSAYRYHRPRTTSYYNIGFRLAL